MASKSGSSNEVVKEDRTVFITIPEGGDHRPVIEFKGFFRGHDIRGIQHELVLQYRRYKNEMIREATNE